MRLPVKLCALSTGIFAIAIAAMLVVGKNQPPPTSIRQLHLADCSSLCVAGIKTNQMSVDATRQHIIEVFEPDGYIERQAFTRSDSSFLYWNKKLEPSGRYSIITIALDNGMATGVTIRTDFPDRSMPNLGEILSTFGEPDCVLAYDETSSALIYEHGLRGNILRVTFQTLKLAQPASNIVLDGKSRLACSMNATYPWRGLYDRTFYHANY